MGETSLAAVGATTSLSDLLIEFMNGVICGYGIIVATYFGAQEENKLRKAIGGTVVLSVVITALLSIGCLIFLPKILNFLNVSPELAPEKEMYGQLLPRGFSMGFMFSFVLMGSLALQTAINALGMKIIVAHTGARKATSLFLMIFFVLGTALATYCGQNLGAEEYGRIRQGIRDAILFSLGWYLFVLLIVFTVSPIIINLNYCQFRARNY